MAGAVLLPLLLVSVGKTHQYKVAQRLKATCSTSSIAEADSILSHPPKLIMPWTAVACLLERAVILHVSAAFIGISAVYLTAAIIPGHFCAAPYRMSTAEIGLILLASLIGVVVSPIAGYLFDKSGSLSPTEPMVRLTYGTLVTALLMPAGFLLFGWGLQVHAHTAVLVIGWTMVGASTFWVMAGVFAYMTYIKPDAASSAIAGVVSGNFVLSGLFIMAGVSIADAVGMLRMFALLAALSVVVIVGAAAQIYCRYKLHKSCRHEATKDAQFEHSDPAVQSPLPSSSIGGDASV
jgi:MFS family permease